MEDTKETKTFALTSTLNIKTFDQLLTAEQLFADSRKILISDSGSYEHQPRLLDNAPLLRMNHGEPELLNPDLVLQAAVENLNPPIRQNQQFSCLIIDETFEESTWNAIRFYCSCQAMKSQEGFLRDKIAKQVFALVELFQDGNLCSSLAPLVGPFTPNGKLIFPASPVGELFGLSDGTAMNRICGAEKILRGQGLLQTTDISHKQLPSETNLDHEPISQPGKLIPPPAKLSLTEQAEGQDVK